MGVPHADHIFGANAGRTSRERLMICEFGETNHEPGKERLGIFRPMNELVDRNRG